MSKSKNKSNFNRLDSGVDADKPGIVDGSIPAMSRRILNFIR
jgi:hypothetical protein